jgi:hypothetical protein
MTANTIGPWRGDRCRCQDCQWKGDEADCDAIEDIFERVDPGEPMPSGQCPKCGALCQPEREHIQVEYDRNYCGGDYSGVGEFALIPVDKIAFEQQGLAEAFEIQVGLPRCHIIHWCWDERYDADGDPLD